MQSFRSSFRTGFTLIEVMIALSIFAMAAVVLGAAYVNVLMSYEVAARGTQNDEDVRFARQQLLVEEDVKKIEEGGEFEGGGGRRVKWKAQAEPTNLPDLFTVDFTCEIADAGKSQTFRERFRLLRPRWSEDADRDKLRQAVRARIEELNSSQAGSASKGGSR